MMPLAGDEYIDEKAVTSEPLPFDLTKSISEVYPSPSPDPETIEIEFDKGTPKDYCKHIKAKEYFICYLSTLFEMITDEFYERIGKKIALEKEFVEQDNEIYINNSEVQYDNSEVQYNNSVSDDNNKNENIHTLESLIEQLTFKEDIFKKRDEEKEKYDEEEKTFIYSSS
tara:strand:- start:69 stop:578 length:510 start_codon:yes stop_codon:yes gene_type:complete